jgi:hypothetical protein
MASPLLFQGCRSEVRSRSLAGGRLVLVRSARETHASLLRERRPGERAPSKQRATPEVLRGSGHVGTAWHFEGPPDSRQRRRWDS